MPTDERNIFEDNQGRKFYDFDGRRIPVNSNVGEKYNDFYKDLENDLEDQTEYLEAINTIRGLLSGEINSKSVRYGILRADREFKLALGRFFDEEDYKKKAWLTGQKYGINLNIDDLLDYKREMRDEDNPLFPFIRQEEDKVREKISELESIQVFLNNSDRNAFEVVKAIESDYEFDSTVDQISTKIPELQAQTPEPIVSETPITPATTPVSAEDDPIFGVSGISNVPPPDPADDPIFGDFGAQADTATVQKQTEEIEVDEGEGDGDGDGVDNQTLSRSAPAPEIEEADVDEVYALLQEQFGGASYFFRKNAQNMQIGLTADGKLVSYNDPNATDTTSLMDYIVENGITSVTRVKGLLQKTEWWQTTDRSMRAFDATWGDMSEPERTEFLEPLTDRLSKEAQFLGFELSDEEQFDLAKNLARFGDSEDQEAIREAVLGQLQYGKMQSDISGFGAAKDAIQQLAYKYYTPIDDVTAQDWAEQIYTGEATNEEYEQYLKATAVSRFPTLDKVINEMGVTPDQYFSPYKYQIEQMLGRQVNMLEEFSDVIEFMPDTGTASRPMTLSEVRKFVRATPEWQQTDDAKDQARALAFSIGQTFGEVA